MAEDVIFHWPPELTQLLVDTIPLLCRSKRDVVLFFVGAGLSEEHFPDIASQVRTDPQSINKYNITRSLISTLNHGEDRWLRQRRELIRRVTEFEDFSTCWPDDQLKAKGLVAEIRRLVGVKDAFTRMQIERERERAARSAAADERAAELAAKQQSAAKIRGDLAGLFLITNPQRRGKALENVLNSLFQHHGILVRDAFSLRSAASGLEVEQIDGVVEFDGSFYFLFRRDEMAHRPRHHCGRCPSSRSGVSTSRVASNLYFCQ